MVYGRLHIYDDGCVLMLLYADTAYGLPLDIEKTFHNRGLRTISQGLNTIFDKQKIKNIMEQDWTEQDNKLSKTYKFKTFADAMSWMIRASYTIEKMDHHPEWTNVYNQVRVSLSTHSAGNKVTEKDRELAKELDAFFAG
jgi:4a-hydroxytetrahydrobiopterin dehydratase